MEELQEVARERRVGASLLKLLPPKHGPRKVLTKEQKNRKL